LEKSIERLFTIEQCRDRMAKNKKKLVTAELENRCIPLRIKQIEKRMADQLKFSL